MSQCPVCETEYIEGQIENCPTCGYDLTPYPLVLGQIPAAFLEKEQKRIAWAKRLWKATKAKLAKAAQKVKEAEIHQVKVDNRKILTQLEQILYKQRHLEQNLKLAIHELDNWDKKNDLLFQQIEEIVYQERVLQAELDFTNFQLNSAMVIINDGSEPLVDYPIVESRYQELDQLLAAKNWAEADRVTFLLMLELAGQKEQGWLNSKDIKTLPCEGIKQIDSLWLKHSNNRYGFSVQKRIWQEVGGNSEADYSTFCRFGNLVGWRMLKADRPSFGIQETWIFYKSDPVSYNRFPGHLPGVTLWGAGPGLCGNEGIIRTVIRRSFVALMCRLIDCDI